MPQDTLKKLRADMEARFVKLESSLPLVNSQPLRENQVGYVRADGATKLPDGTWQFPAGATGPVVNTVPNTTPAVPREYGVGAVVMFQGYTAPVLQVGDGIILVQRPDVDPIWLYPRDVVLVTPAP